MERLRLVECSIEVFAFCRLGSDDGFLVDVGQNIQVLHLSRKSRQVFDMAFNPFDYSRSCRVTRVGSAAIGTRESSP